MFHVVYILYSRLYNYIISCRIKCNKGVIYSAHQLLGGEFISIGEKSNILKNSIITAWKTEKYGDPSITIGENTNIGENAHISAVKSVTIGNGVLTGRYVYISDNSHGEFVKEQLDISPSLRPLYVKGPVIIEDNVWIGERVCVLSGVTIGKGSIVAANAVVTHDVPPYSMVAGVPAKIIKQLS